MALGEFHSSYFSVREDGDVAVVEFELPQLSDDQNVEQMGRDLFALDEHYDCRRVVLDLRRVEYVTSSVLGKFITLHRRLHRAGGVLVLCHVAPPVKSLLHTSRLDAYFHIGDDVARAAEMARSG